MRIIGGHDYYDSGLAYGRDDAITFLRNGDRRMTEGEMHDDIGLPRFVCGIGIGDPKDRIESWGRPNDHWLKSIEYRIEGKARRHTIHHGSVILCGRLHHGVHIETTKPYGYSETLDKRWIWKADGLRAFADEYDLALDDGREGTVRKHLPFGGGLISVPILGLDQWFEPLDLSDRVRNALVDARITIASKNPMETIPFETKRQDRPWAIDQATLSDMQFAKAVDPYTAFQEISMWKGGVLPSDGPKIVEIQDNAIKIAKAGFHHPTSFRRPKENRR